MTQEDSHPVTAVARADTVMVRNFAYGPSSLVVCLGAKVAVVNGDCAPQTVTARNKFCDIGVMGRGSTGWVYRAHLAGYLSLHLRLPPVPGRHIDREVSSRGWVRRRQTPSQAARGTCRSPRDEKPCVRVAWAIRYLPFAKGFS